MCIPLGKTKVVDNTTTAIQPPSSIPSVQAATNLQLGGDVGGAARGAAQLGRLKLRIGGDTQAAPRTRLSPPPGGTTDTGVTTSPASVPSYSGEGLGGFPIRGFTLGDGAQAL